MTEPLQYIRHADWLRESARRACRLTIAPYWQKLLTYRLPAQLAARACFFAEQSDCLLAVGHR